MTAAGGRAVSTDKMLLVILQLPLKPQIVILRVLSVYGLNKWDTMCQLVSFNGAGF